MHALSIHNLIKIYSNGQRALNGIDLKVKQGDFFGLLGPNGAGKTTLIGIISSLVKKTSGTISVFDYDIDHNFELAKSLIGVVPQEFNFGIFSKVEHILHNQAGYYGIPPKLAKQRTETYLKKLDLWEKRNQLAYTLSGGMKRRLMIARALVHEPRLLILDEPTAGVDVELRRSMWEFLREINQQGTTIILTTHYIEEAETLCKNIAIIDNGEIIENASVGELLYKLNMETFVLYLKQAMHEAPSLENFTCRLINEKTLEVDLQVPYTLSELIAALSNKGIDVVSLKNKSNRLEELFVHLTADVNNESN